MFMANDAITATTYTVYGLLVMIGAVLVLSEVHVNYNWQIGLLLLVISIYMLGRASGHIAEPWLAKIVGIACIFAVIVLLFVTWPRHPAPPATPPL